MDEPEKVKIETTPEEIAAEAEATKGVTEDEIKEKIATDLELDPDIDADLIEKLAKREKESRDSIRKAVGQKIKFREALKNQSQKPKDKPEEGKPQEQKPEDINNLVDQKVNERLDARDLESLDIPDELKDEVKKLAKVNGISIREAAKDPYIQYQKEKIEKDQKIKDALPKKKNGGSYQGPIDPNKPLDPENYDFDSKEGVEKWKKDKATRDKVRANS